MDPSSLHYDLPPEQIAQEPAERREHSRLLVVDRAARRLRSRRFFEIAEHLAAGDLLVLNDTRVGPSRIRGRRPSGGRVELTFVDPEADGSGPWALVRPGRRISAGMRIELDGAVVLEVERVGDGGRMCFRVIDGDLEDALAQHGKMPLPPYIRRQWDHEDAAPADGGGARDGLDRERYQTVVAEHRGAVAAPTAGLHFTRELLASLAEAGVASTTVTLHVGYGSFQPVRTERVEDHRLRPERFEVSEEASERISETRARGGRIVAVGTTVVRTLERAVMEEGRVEAGSGWTDLMILPGHRFLAVDALVTNFHQPMTTLFALALAFGGVELMHEAYGKALDEGFRFLSYGDAMLLV